MYKSSRFIIVIALVLSAALLGNVMLVNAAQSSQENGITVLIDGKPVSIGQECVLINGNVMAPIETVAEAMGWEVRTNNPTVIELAKSVKYTDGSKNYLFSNHTITLNLEREWINRSIMVGIGHFYDTAADRKISFTVKPAVVNGKTLISLNDLQKCLYAEAEWNEANRTVSIASGEIPYYDGQGLANRDELFEQMRTYNKVNGALTKVGEQPAQPVTKTSPEITSLFKPAGIMTSAPKVGSFPAKILLPGKTDVNTMNSYYEPYKYSVGHGCNWFAFGRFYETYGYRIPVPYTGGSVFLDTVEQSDATTVRAERDLDEIISGCIAVYWREKNGGHVVFVEYVERDANGNPVNVYYTECMNSDGSGTYKPATDAKVKKTAFERFKKSSSGTKDLMGYIVPNQ